MGGGGAMRAAASRVAGIGSIRSGLPDHHSVVTAARRGSRTVVSSPAIEDGKSVVVLSSQNNKNDATASVVSKPSWEIDDWEFAGGEDDLLLDSMYPTPRVVFGSVPSLEEATEATCDLKDALEKVYFTPSDGGVEKSSGVVEESTLSMQSPTHSETKACINFENALVQPALNSALQAFSLLKENPAVQNVVAALASDKNVWDAVMQNDKVMEFMKQQRTTRPSPVTDEYQESQDSSKTVEIGGDDKSSGNVFMEFIEDVKVRVAKIEIIQEVKAKVAKMVSSFSAYFHNIFGGPTDPVDGNGSAPAANITAASFMGLAMLAIMVVVLKRG